MDRDWRRGKPNVDLIEVFRCYVEDRRQMEIAQFDREFLGHVARYTAKVSRAEGLVAYTNLIPGREVSQIAEQMEFTSGCS